MAQLLHWACHAMPSELGPLSFLCRILLLFLIAKCWNILWVFSLTVCHFYYILSGSMTFKYLALFMAWMLNLYIKLFLSPELQNQISNQWLCIFTLMSKTWHIQKWTTDLPCKELFFSRVFHHFKWHNSFRCLAQTTWSDL